MEIFKIRHDKLMIVGKRSPGSVTLAEKKLIENSKPAIIAYSWFLSNICTHLLEI